MATTKRKRTQLPALLRAATQLMPYHHFCAVCKIEIGTSSHIVENPQPIYCTACKKAIREGIAA